jgi:hypothetical protein
MSWKPSTVVAVTGGWEEEVDEWEEWEEKEAVERGGGGAVMAAKAGPTGRDADSWRTG